MVRGCEILPQRGYLSFAVTYRVFKLPTLGEWVFKMFGFYMLLALFLEHFRKHFPKLSATLGKSPFSNPTLGKSPKLESSLGNQHFLVVLQAESNSFGGHYMRKKNFKGRCEKKTIDKCKTVCKTFDPKLTIIIEPVLDSEFYIRTMVFYTL